MTENTQQVRRPAPQAPQGDKGRRRLSASTIFAGSAALVLAGALALASWRSCKPRPEKIVKKDKVVQVQSGCPELPSKPVKGDKKCEMDKGEHDPTSKNWDPKSCGYCGDGEQQKWETEETCPVDFHCGNGKIDRRTLFGTLEPLSDGKMKLTYVRITESCNKRSTDYCEEDCTGKKPKRRVRKQGGTGMATVSNVVVKTVPTAKPGGPCKGGDPSTIRAIKSAVYTALDGASQSIKNAHNPDGARIFVKAMLFVSSTGKITGKRITSTCIGTCTTKSLNARKLVSLGAVPSSIGAAPGVKCTLTYKRVYR